MELIKGTRAYTMWAGMLLILTLLPTRSFSWAAARKIEVWDYNEWNDWVTTEFTQKTGIEIEKMTVMSGNAQMVRIVAGETPDVIRIGKQYFGEFISKGLVADLTPFANRELFPIKDVLAVENVMHQGRLLGAMPLANTKALRYNEDLFFAAGLQVPDALIKQDRWTYDVFLEAAKKLTLDLNGDGQPDQFAAKANFSNEDLLMWLWSNGAELIDESNTARLNTPEARRAMEFLASLHSEYRVTKAADVTSGTVAMDEEWAGPHAEYPWMKFALHPRGPHTQPDGYAMLINSSPFIVYSGSRSKELGWEFIKFVLSPEVQMRGVLAGSAAGYAKPLRLSLLPQALREARAKHPGYNWDLFYSAQQRYGRPFPKPINLSMIVGNVRSQLRKVIAGEFPVASFVDQMNDIYTKIARGEMTL